jgi:hypothetical protein
MTKKKPTGAFIKVGDALKFETDADMAKRFAAACLGLGVKQTHVLRHIIWEFVHEAENGELAEGAH